MAPLVTVPGQLKVVAADPDDVVVVECALIGRADHRVTADRHLSYRGHYAGMQMARPTRFVELVTADE